MTRLSLISSSVLFLVLSQTGCDSKPDLIYEDDFIQGIFEGCITAAGNNSSETQRRCECATDVLVDNLSDEDWKSVHTHFDNNKSFGSHPRLRELIPKIQQCN